MTDEMTFLDLPQACSYLGLSLDDYAVLLAHRLVTTVDRNGHSFYSKIALDLTKHLLTLGRTYGWSPATLGWYTDLVFAAQVGRTILLPIAGKKETTLLAESWLATPYVAAVLNDVDNVLNEPDGPLVPLLQSLTTLAIGEGRFWTDQKSLAQSALYPLIAHFEAQGIPILDQTDTIGRDAAPIFALMLIAFTSIAPPISQDLTDLLSTVQVKLGETTAFEGVVSPQDRAIISKEALIAVDKLYATKKPEIHTAPEMWDFNLGVMSAQRRTITFELKLPLDSTEIIIDNIIDLIRPYVGPVGARVVHLLYEIANDEPYWRNPPDHR